LAEFPQIPEGSTFAVVQTDASAGAGRVVVDQRAIERARRAGGGLWLLFEIPPSPAVYDAAWQAMSEANAQASSLAATAEVGGSGVGLTAKGPVLHIGFADTPEALAAFVAEVAAQLEAAGLTGRLGVARSEAAAFDQKSVVCLAAAATVPLDEAKIARHAAESPALMLWDGQEEATDAVVERAVEWVGEVVLGDGTVLLSTGQFQRRCAPGDAMDQLRFHLANGTGQASVLGIEADPAGRRVTFSPEGHMGAVIRPASGERLDELAALRTFLTSLAPHLEQGLVRQSGSLPGNWGQVVTALPPLAPWGRRETSTRWLALGRHLFDRFVVDPYGAQLLTGAHLAAVPDWGSWSVERVADDRFWVQAPDVLAWIEGEAAPLPSVLAARDLFRPILLTPEVVALHPRPW
jgi:hypothetical protein